MQTDMFAFTKIPISNANMLEISSEVDMLQH